MSHWKFFDRNHRTIRVWNPDHVDIIVQNGTYVSEHRDGTDRDITGMTRPGCLYMFQVTMNMYVHVSLMYMYIHLCIMMVCNMPVYIMMIHIQVHAFLYLYVRCTYIVCIDVTVNTSTCHTLPVFGHCTYTSVQLTTTVTLQVHFPLGPISLATAASLSCAQEQLLLSSLLPGTSRFNRQTTQVLLT